MRSTFFVRLAPLALLLAAAAPRARADATLITYGGDVVLGNFTTTTMELGGTTRGTQYDAIDVAGKLTLGGTLTVTLINSFSPALGNSFNLFDWGTKAGTFTTVNVPALNTGLTWNQSNLYLDGTLSIALDPAFTSRTWDGGGANNNWITNANWSLDLQPLNNGTADLVFAGNVRLAPSVDTAWNIRSITFNNTAGAFSLAGPQGVTVGTGGITNGDADTQTITAALTLGANAAFTAASAALNVGSVALAGNTLTIAGAAATTLGSISGAGTVTKTGAGTLTVTGSLGTGLETFNANAGETIILASQTLSALNIGDGAEVTFGDGLALVGEAKTGAAVPEPGTTALLLAGALGLLRRGAKRAARMTSSGAGRRNQCSKESAPWSAARMRGVRAAV